MMMLGGALAVFARFKLKVTQLNEKEALVPATIVMWK